MYREMALTSSLWLVVKHVKKRHNNLAAMHVHSEFGQPSAPFHLQRKTLQIVYASAAPTGSGKVPDANTKCA